MNQYTMVSLILVILGFALMFMLDNVIPIETQNSTLKMIRNHNMIIGGVAVSIAYYMYNLGENANRRFSLPSYENATDDILNM